MQPLAVRTFLFCREDGDEIASYWHAHNHSPDPEETLSHEKKYEDYNRMHVQNVPGYFRVENISFKRMNGGYKDYEIQHQGESAGLNSENQYWN